MDKKNEIFLGEIEKVEANKELYISFISFNIIVSIIFF